MGVVVAVLILMSTIAFCIYKAQTKTPVPNDPTREDENPVYGLYGDPDPVAEVEDSNDYYADPGVEGVSRTRDNNSQYGYA